MSREIICRKLSRYNFSITVDGRVREGFNSIGDCAEWVGAMQAHGLYIGYDAVIEGDNGRMTQLIPTYEYPFREPAILSFI